MNGGLSELLGKALALYNAGDLQASLEAYNLVLQRDPGNPVAISYLGGILHEIGEHEKAVFYLSQAPFHLLNPKSSAIIYRRLASSLVETKDYVGAIENFKRMFVVCPDHMREITKKYLVDTKDYGPARVENPVLLDGLPGNEPSNVFSTIYEQNFWGDGSGGGSNLDKSAIYLAYLQYLIDTYKPRTILDIGCGDWRFSQYINFGDAYYTGFDVVASVIDENKKRFSSDRVTFVACDATRVPLPQADLIVCKDVVQHLSDELAIALVNKCTAADMFLLTNDYSPVNVRGELGGTRALNPTAEPFNLQAEPVLYFSGKISYLATKRSQ